MEWCEYISVLIELSKEKMKTIKQKGRHSEQRKIVEILKKFGS